MKALIISNFYPPYAVGGGEMAIADFAQVFSSSGWDIRILTSGRCEAEVSGAEGVQSSLAYHEPPVYEPGIAFIRQLRKLAHYRAAYFDSVNARLVERTILSIEPDIVITGSILGLGLVSVADVLAHANAPVVAHLQDYWLLRANDPDESNSKIRLRYVKRALAGFATPTRLARGMRLLIANSIAVKDRHLAAGLPPGQFQVVYNGIRSERIRSSPVDRPRTGRILFVGRIVPQKGLHVLLAALGRVNYRVNATRISLEIVGGNGPEEYLRQLRDLAVQMGVANDTTWHGWLNREAITTLYDNCDALVVPSQWPEPFGIVAIEALAQGIPVIASRLGGLPEIVEDERNGLLFNPQDSTDLARCIERIVTGTASWWASLSIEALAVTRERFCLQSNAEKLMGHYARVVDKSRGAPT